MRTYEQSHPWITFRLDLSHAPYNIWLLLGEAQSKIEHIAGIPLLPSVQQEFHQLFLAKGVRATTAIEGNTLSEEEVRLQLEGQLKLPPSKEYLKIEIENIIGACNSILKKILSSKSTELSVAELKEYNKSVLKGLPLQEDVRPGRFRTYQVGVGNYKGAPPEDVEFLTKKLVKWLNSGFQPKEGLEIGFGLLKAIMAHLYIAWIHPFGDGNGRTARLIELEILLRSNVPTVAAHLMSNHYNQTRSMYYSKLDEVSKNGGNPIPFIVYALQGLVDGQREQIERVKEQQLLVHWINYIHDRFRNQDTLAGHRRRKLAIDLSQKTEPVPFADIRHITPRIAEAYAGKTDKTVKRDLNYLKNMNIIEKRKEGFRARPELMFAFLPAKKESNSNDS